MRFFSTTVFAIFRLVSGDPAAIKIGYYSSASDYSAPRKDVCPNYPLHVQYLRWMGNLARGDFGKSITHGYAEVSSLVFPALGRTLELAALSILLAVIVAVPLGMISAIREGTWVDHVARVFTTLGFSMPTYVMGIGLLILLAEVFPLLPPGGYVPFGEDPVKHLSQLIMPVLTIASVTAARLTRFMRAGMLEVLSADYVRTARAKGLTERRVNYWHAFRNAAIPLVTEVGVNFGLLVGGMVVIEQIFIWPGLGWLMIQSILTRAFDVVQIAVLVSAATFVIVNLLVDLTYSWLDPRIARS